MSPGELSNLCRLLKCASNPHQRAKERVRDLCGELEKIVLAQGDYLFKHGQSGDAMYVVLKGSLQAATDQEDGTRIAAWDVRPGDLAGEMEVVLGGTRATDVQAIEEAELAKVPKAAFEEVSDECPDLTEQMVQNVRAKLRRIQLVTILPSLFGRLNEGTLCEVEPKIEWVHLRRNEQLFRQGDSGDSLYIIVSGRLRVVREDEDGTEHVIAELGRGENVGEMALITGEPRSASLYAIRDTELMRLSKSAFDEIAKTYPEVMMSIARTLVGRLRKKELPLRTINTVTTIAVVPGGSEVPSADFAGRLADALSVFGSAIHLSAAGVDKLLGRSGLAHTPEEGPYHSRLAAWLDEQETKHRFVIYETDIRPTAWTRRCIRQADQVVVVAWAHASPSPGETETTLLGPVRPITRGRRTLVLLHPHGGTLPSGTSHWLAPRQVQEHHHIRWDQDTDFRRLARFFSGRTIGLALGGGGALCMAHVGVIQALDEAGVPIDIVGGTSMGAVIAVLCAMGHDHQTMIRLNRKGWIEAKPFSEYTLPLVSLFRSRKFDQIAKMACGDACLEDLWLNCFCVSSNLTKSEMVLHRRGPAWKALRASASLPGIAVPVLDNGDLLVDGGVFNNLPGDVLRELGAGHVIAVNVSSRQGLSVDHDLIPSPWEILWSRILPHRKAINVPSILRILMASTLASSQHRTNLVKTDADVYFRPPLGQYSLLEFAAMDEIYRVGYAYAREQIQELSEDKAFRRLLASAGQTPLA